MEFGPRALGSRSIIGDARSPKMQSVMNLKIKFRESFRPFAPIVLRERARASTLTSKPGMRAPTCSSWRRCATRSARDSDASGEGPRQAEATALDVIPRSRTSTTRRALQTVDGERNPRLARSSMRSSNRSALAAPCSSTRVSTCAANRSSARRFVMTTTVIVLVSIVAVTAVLGAVFPAAIRPIFIALMVVTFPIGFVISHILLGFLYYGVFTPIGLLLRLSGRDSMGQKIDKSATTYFTKHTGPRDSASYFKQF
jgi:hypothetical protein